MQYEGTLLQFSFFGLLELAKRRRWGDRCAYKMHSLADRAYITGRVFSALGLLTLPWEFLVWGKVQKGLHYHCSGACSNKTFLVCKKVQWVLYYKGFFWSIRRWCGALHYKAISRLGKVQLKLGWMGSIVRLVREVTTEVG